MVLAYSLTLFLRRAMMVTQRLPTERSGATLIKSLTENHQTERTGIGHLSPINALWNHGDEDAWIGALEHYYELLSVSQIPLERKMERINHEEIQVLSVEDFYRFLHNDYFVWKYTQKNRLATTRKQLERYATEGRMYELEFIKSRLFATDHNDIRECLTVASSIRGLGTAGASGLLAILFPHDFGTVDQFVAKSLLDVDGLKEHQALTTMKPDSLKVDDGVLLTEILRQKAASLNTRFSSTSWTPRKIDMVLWSVGR